MDDYSPSESAIINVFDYESPQSLALFLNDLNRNDQLYLKAISHRWNTSAISKRFREKWWQTQVNLNVYDKLCSWVTDAYILNASYSRNGDFTCWEPFSSGRSVEFVPYKSGSKRYYLRF